MISIFRYVDIILAAISLHRSDIACMQENWVQLVRPRCADIKFKLPYHGASTYSYLKGELRFQHFGKQSSSEARLLVDAPQTEVEEYGRQLYNRHIHDDCLFYHNFVTRLEHQEAPNKIKLSYDQHMAHEIICQWMKKACDEEDFSGLKNSEERKSWVSKTLKDIDNMYDRTLGLCLCPEVQEFAKLREGTINEEEAVLAITPPDEVQATPEQQIQMRRLWKKNTNADVERRKQKMQKQLQDQIQV
jgi:hypothetical protein